MSTHPPLRCVNITDDRSKFDQSPTKLSTGAPEPGQERLPDESACLTSAKLEEEKKSQERAKRSHRSASVYWRPGNASQLKSTP